MPPLSHQALAPALSQTPSPSSLLSRTSPNTAVASSTSSKAPPGTANLAEAVAEKKRTSIHKGEVEACTAGAATGDSLACDDVPPTSASTPAEASGSDFSQPQAVAGQTSGPPSTAEEAKTIAAPGKVRRDCGDSQEDVDGKVKTTTIDIDIDVEIEKRLVGPSEREIGSTNGNGYGPNRGNATKPEPTVRCGSSLPVDSTSPSQARSPLPPVDMKVEEDDRDGVLQTSRAASMEHLRRAALAAVSLSAEQDAGVKGGGGNDVDRTTENRRRPSVFAGSESEPPSSSCSCSPTRSPCPSSPSLSSPSHFLPGEGVRDPDPDLDLDPEVNVNVVPVSPDAGTAAADPAPSANQAKRSTSTLNPASANLSPETRANVDMGGAGGKTAGGGTLPSRTAMASTKALGAAIHAHADVDVDVDVERESGSSSFSVSVSAEDENEDEDEDEEEKRAGETTVRRPQSPS